MEEIEFPQWFFEGRPRQGKKLLPDCLDWLSYLAGSSKRHSETSISCIFLQSPHQVDMKNVVKWWKDFLSYFTTLETYRVQPKCEGTEGFKSYFKLKKYPFFYLIVIQKRVFHSIDLNPSWYISFS